MSDVRSSLKGQVSLFSSLLRGEGDVLTVEGGLGVLEHRGGRRADRVELVLLHPDLGPPALVDERPEVVEVTDRNLGRDRVREHHHLVTSAEVIPARAVVVVDVDHLRDPLDQGIHFREQDLLPAHHVLPQLHEPPARVLGGPAQLLPPREHLGVPGQPHEVVFDGRELVTREVPHLSAEHGPAEPDRHREWPLLAEERALVAVSVAPRPVVRPRLEGTDDERDRSPVEADFARDPLLEVAGQTLNELQLIVALDGGEVARHLADDAVGSLVTNLVLDPPDQPEHRDGVLLGEALEDLDEVVQAEHLPRQLVLEEGELELALLVVHLEQGVADEVARSAELDRPAQNSHRFGRATLVHLSELLLDLVVVHGRRSPSLVACSSVDANPHLRRRNESSKF